jgi:hypothetical protein
MLSAMSERLLTSMRKRLRRLYRYCHDVVDRRQSPTVSLPSLCRPQSLLEVGAFIFLAMICDMVFDSKGQRA